LVKPHRLERRPNWTPVGVRPWPLYRICSSISHTDIAKASFWVTSSVHLDAMLLMYSTEAVTNLSFAFQLLCSVNSGKDVAGIDGDEATGLDDVVLGMEDVDTSSTL
jgi:hypothetical protein